MFGKTRVRHHRSSSGPGIFRSSHRPASRAAAALLSVCVAFTMMPAPAFAVTPERTAETGLCEHHPVHTPECGYQEAEPGHLCEHKHTADCYTDELICGLEETTTETASGSDAGHTHSQDCYKLDCPHKRGNHDESCGYTEGEKGVPCGYVCAECKKPEEGGGNGNTTNGNPTGGNNLPVPEETRPELVRPDGTEDMTVTSFDELDEAVQNQTVGAGTPLEELALPETLSATAQAGDEEPEPVTVQGVIWEPDTPYEGAAGQTYTFTASAEGYVCAAGVDWPVITVTMEKAEPDEVDALCAAIDVLPTVEELYENAPGDADPEFDAWVSETRTKLESVPALWEQLSKLKEDSSAMERITEARAEKLAALHNLAERLAEMETLDVPATPTVSSINIYANGVPLLLTSGSTDKTKTVVYIDKGTIGQFDEGTDELFNLGTGYDNTENGNDLSGWLIYGGSESTPLTADTNITMTGGKVFTLFGGGETAALTGNTSVTVTGNAIVQHRIHGGGHARSVIGNTVVTIGGTAEVAAVLGGGAYGKVNGSTSITVTDNAQVSGGISSGGIATDSTVNGSASITVTGNAQVAKSIDCNSVTGGKTVTVGGGVQIGNDTNGIIINGGTGNVSNGVDSFVIGDHLTENASVNVKLPAGYDVSAAPTIAAGAVEGDVAKLKLMGDGAAGKEAYFDSGAIKVWEKPAAPAWISGGEGTEASPYEIESYDQLNGFAANVSGTDTYTSDAFEGVYFKLSNTFPVNGTAKELTAAIGTNTKRFKGHFDGGGRTVELSIDQSGSDYQGLFGYVGFGGVVENVTVAGTVKGKDYVGGVAGWNEGGTVQNCVNEAAVTGTGDNVGGVTGYNGGTVQNCINKAAVTGTGDNIGGVTGWNSNTVQNCANKAVVTGAGDKVGGVAGWNESGMVQNCANEAAVTGTGNKVGGVIGYLYGSAIKNCYNIGTVTGQNYVGGVAGEIKSYLTAENCLSLGLTVTATGADSSYIGRVAGSIGANNIVNNKARSDMKVGKKGSEAVVTLTDANGIHGGDVAVGAAALSDVFTGWDSGIWNIPDGNLTYGCDLPVLNALTGEAAPILPGKASALNVAEVTIGSQTSQYTDFNAAWQAATADTVTETVTVKLLADVNADSMMVASGRDMIIDLAGKTLEWYDGFIQVDDGGRLTLKDSTAPWDDSMEPGNYSSGALTGGNAFGIVFITGGTFVMESGTIKGNSLGAGVMAAGNFTMNGGLITGNSISTDLGAGVRFLIQTNVTDTFTMTGGAITGNKGIGVSVEPDAKIVLSDKIMIAGNTKADGTTPGNLYLKGPTPSKLEIASALPAGSSVGVGMDAPGEFASSDGAAASLAAFTSDDAGYQVKAEGNALKLAEIKPAWAAGGEGTEDSPYLIDTYQQLADFAANVIGTGAYGGKASMFENTYIKLTDTFPAQDGSLTALSNSIGTPADPFRGHFDGGGRTVELNIDQSGNGHQGLFGGVGLDGVVENVTVTGMVKGSNIVGGVAGHNSGTVQNCVNKAVVSGKSSVGGVAGSNLGTMQNCVNEAAVTGTGYNVGGVAGYNLGTVQNCANKTVVTGGNVVGGVAGRNEGTVQNCVNEAAVTGTGYSVGGVTGIFDGGRGNKIINCYNIGEVTGKGDVGGVTGGILVDLTVKNCLSLGLTVTSTGTDSSVIGRVTGYIVPVNNVNNQARSDMKIGKEGGETIVTSTNAAGLHGADMAVDGSLKLSDVFAGWDTDVWTVPDGRLTYGCALPKLKALAGEAPTLPGEAPAKNTDAALSALKYTVDSGTEMSVSGFAADTETYNEILPYGTAQNAVITLTAALNDSSASITENIGVTLANGSGTATVKITAEDKTTTRTYTVNFTIAGDTRSGAKQITAFEILNQVGGSAIDQSSHTITVTMPNGTDVTGLIPTVTVSDKAAVSPQSGAAQNFTAPVTYTVTAENGTKQAYTVMISVQKPTVTTHAITASAGSGGTISPSGTVTVNEGESKSFTVTPNSKYSISQVTVDGVDIGAVEAYTFEYVNADHSITAAFHYNGGGSSGGGGGSSSGEGGSTSGGSSSSAPTTSTNTTAAGDGGSVTTTTTTSTDSNGKTTTVTTEVKKDEFGTVTGSETIVTTDHIITQPGPGNTGVTVYPDGSAINSAAEAAGASAQSPADMLVKVPQESVNGEVQKPDVNIVEIDVILPNSVRDNPAVQTVGVTVESETVEAARETGKILEVTVREETGAVEAVWSLDGEAMRNAAEQATDLNLGVRTAPVQSSDPIAAPVKQPVTAAGQDNGLVISLMAEGTLLSAAKLTVPAADQTGITAGSTVTLYRFDPSTGTLNAVPGGVYGVDANGNVTVDIPAGTRVSAKETYVLLQTPAVLHTDADGARGGTVHTIKAGDTLNQISRQYGCKVEDLLALNPGVDIYNLQIGSDLRVR